MFNLDKLPFSHILRADADRDVVIGKKRGSFLFQNERLTEREMNLHTNVVGPSGFGKTVLISHILQKKIGSGAGLLYVDLKGDRETISDIRSMADKVGRKDDVLIFSITDPSISKSYDLLRNGTATQLRDRVIASFVWTEEYYKNKAASFLLKVLVGFCALREKNVFSFGVEHLLTAVSKPSFLEELYLRLKKFANGSRELRIFEESVSFEECYSSKFIDRLARHLEDENTEFFNCISPVI